MIVIRWPKMTSRGSKIVSRVFKIAGDGFKTCSDRLKRCHPYRKIRCIIDFAPRLCEYALVVYDTIKLNKR